MGVLMHMEGYLGVERARNGVRLLNLNNIGAAFFRETDMISACPGRNFSELEYCF